MRITDLLSKNGIALNIKLNSKNDAINKLVQLQQKCGNLTDAKKYRDDIIARENHSSTAVGDGIAIPHAKSDAVKKAGLVAATVPNGVDYGSFDKKPSDILFMIAAPTNGNDVHLDVLSRLMTMLMDEKFRNDLKSAKSADDFIRIIDKAESDKYNIKKQDNQKNGYSVLAVTACPTGIAHTYMAAEALEKAAKELGVSIKVETNGSSGAKNVLTQEDIKNAEGIIVAADKSVDMARFEGKRVILTKVADGIRKPEELISRITRENTPVYHHSSKPDVNYSGDIQSESLPRKLYKHLMNGVSNMLPFVVGGGIFIAIAFLIDTIAGYSGSADFGSVSPTASFFKGIGSIAFNFMIPVLAGYIGRSIADRPGLLVGFVGGFLATTGATFSSINGGVPSGFLGALFAGFVGGYTMLLIERLSDLLPKSLEGIKPVLIYPIFGLGLIAVIMCAVNPIMGYINTALTNMLDSMGDTSRVLLGAVLGGMMAVDMGGPFNKAAYVFGTAAITTGNYDIMAAVMIGGMVPPLAIALATTFFKRKFTDDEQKSGAVNYIMGLSFITEGAIPYAASDPLRVIPSCILGSAIAGALSMLWHCTLMAPHGGIFVFAVVGHKLLYFISLVIGSLVGMIMLGLLKKNIRKE